MKDVTIIGLGRMGTALARTLLSNDFSVTVWNRSADKAEALAVEGAIVAGSFIEAVSAASTIVVCIKSHAETRVLLDSAHSLENRNIIELSTGSAPEALALRAWLRQKGARCLIGMICTFPRDIGKEDSTIITAGSESLWAQSELMLKVLAGKSTYIGDQVDNLAILYSALFIPRQGFMFGMIYGALLCNKAGVSMDTYVEQLPLTMKVMQDYYEVFASSVPGENFDNPQASVDTYVAAFRDTLESFEDNDVNDEFPRLLAKLVNQAADAGLGDKQVTTLVSLLRR